MVITLEKSHSVLTLGTPDREYKVAGEDANLNSLQPAFGALPRSGA